MLVGDMVLVPQEAWWAIGALVALFGFGFAARLARRSTPAIGSAGVQGAITERRGSALLDALAATRAVLLGPLERLRGGPVDAAAVEALEEALLRADVGMPTTSRLLDGLVARGADGADAVREKLRARAADMLTSTARPLDLGAGRPAVVLVVGVNGSGKTTSIGKLAAKWRAEGRGVVLAAADTYRAAAADQLQIWAERAGATLVRREEGADPAAVVHAAVDEAVAASADILIVDTAGRLQTARPLMEQLSKIRRVIDKKLPGQPTETLLVIDGTMGQNAMSQAKSFHEATPLTGAVVTKLDGTAKGGMILALASELALPVKFIGVGEKVDDLRPFDPDAFIDALF